MATSSTPPSSSLPEPLSYEEILGQELSTYVGSAGINDINTASVNVSFLQLVALMVSRSSGDLFQVLRDASLDRAVGPALQNLAIEYGVTPLGAKVATSSVTVTDLSFNKISTKIYAGANPPNLGSTSIFVSDASLFPASGALYIGRGSVNVEGPISYGSSALSATGNTTNLSNVIGGLTSTANLIVGFPISGAGIPANSVISSIDSTTQIHISQNATTTASGVVFTFNTPPVQVGSFWEISLDSQTTKFHNISESVILAQGGVRTVPTNTVVVSPGVGSSSGVQYTVTQKGIILDGETTVSNIPITAQLPGAAGNVPAGAISQFAGNPPGLSNASVNNPSAVTTGRDTEVDNALRIRVKAKLASTGLGTVTAIESALDGVQSPDSSDTIVSTDFLNSSSNTIVYIDNGAAYESTHLGVAIETIVNSALGGEKFFQLVTGGKQTSVTKALLQTVASSPYALSGGEHLTVVVGNVTYEHIFQVSDFANPGSATAYEICASLNANTSLNYEAVTAGNGTYVVIRPEDETTNTIQITTPADPASVDANNVLQFPSQKAETLRLYKNGILLIEDGTTASIFTQSQSLWSPTIADGETLSLSVDGTAPITYTLTDAQFLAEGTYTTLSSSNSLQSWVNVLNNNITGITASIVGSTIEITSNLGPVNRAEVTVVNTVSHPTSLIGKGFISNTDLSSTGVKSDYILDRNTAQIQLASALVKNDVLSAGTPITQANIKANAVPSGSITLTSDAHVWISIDTDALLIPSIVGGSTLSVSKISPNIIRYTSNSSTSFVNVLPGDYVIVWSEEIPLSDRLEGRVHTVSGSNLDIEITAAEYASATPVTNAAFIQGFVVVRSENVPQKFRVLAGSKTLDVIAAELQTQTDEATFGVFDNTTITVVDNTFDTAGQIMVVTADSFGSLMGFAGGISGTSQDALIAFYETTASSAELPLFFHSTISADSFAEPIDSYLTNFSSTLSVDQFDPNELVQFLNPYGLSPAASGTLTKVSGVGDSTIAYSSFVVSGTPSTYTFTVTSASANAGAVYSNNTIFFTVTNAIISSTTLVTTGVGLIDDEQPAEENVQISSRTGNSINILPEYPNVRRLRIGDRYFIANPLDFGYNDSVVAIIDNNAVGETYTLPLYRRAIVNSNWPANNFSFDAYDVDTGPTASFATNFSGFDFSNFKVLMQPKFVLQGSNPQSALLIRSALFGRSGEMVNVSYVYPTSANQPINSTVTTPGLPNQYIFAISSGSATPGCIYTNNGRKFTVAQNVVSGSVLITTGSDGPPISSGVLTLIDGSGDSTITFSSYKENDSVSVKISLISGNPITSSIAANTRWNVAVTTNTPTSGTDQVTYTWAGQQYTFLVTAANATAGDVYTNNGHSFTVINTISGSTSLNTTGTFGNPPTISGVLTLFSGSGDATINFSSYTFSGSGTNPALSLSGGEYVTILPSTGFNPANTGTFKISTVVGFTPTSTSFSVQTASHIAVNQSNVLTGVNNGINFYAATPTTALAINTYINSNLSQYITSSIVNDGGSSGSGVIVFSTYEDSGFVHPFYYLKDGINWIASSNITGDPQFTLKNPLTYSSDTGYSFFTSGDEVRLIPTTMDQVQRLWSILAVTGFTTVGTIEVVDRGTKLQLATNTIGSSGSIQIVGGSGNEYVVPVLTSGELIGSSDMVIFANKIASQAVMSDQWFRLQAQSFQNKNTGIGNNTSVTVLSNTPIAGQSTVTLLNQDSDQLYFGSPRNGVRVEGSTFRIEKQGSLACLSWNGVGSSPEFNYVLNFNDTAGWTVDVASDGTYTVTAGNANFSALSIGDSISISGLVNPNNNGTFLVESVALDGSSFKVSNPLATVETGTAITAGEFSSTSGVSEGDTVILSSPFAPLNQGEYRVIRMFNNSIWYENANVVEEEVTCSPNVISTGYNSSSVFNVTVSGGRSTLVWTGAGTSPLLGSALPGDIVTFAGGFSSPNQGSFMAVGSGPSQTQIVQFNLPAGINFSSAGAADYFEVYNGGNANGYYIWYNVLGGSNTDPAPVGLTGIQVNINVGDSAATVANETNSAITAATPVALTNSVSGNVVTISTTLARTTNSPVNVSMPPAFTFTITQLGQTAFLTVINPSAVPQSGISSVTFSIDRPQIQFFPYEVTVPGDKLVVNGNVLGSGNAGTYKIVKILSQNTVIVSGVISQQFNNNLASNAISLSVQEGTAYTGYKQVLYVSAQPGTSNFNNIVFNTSAQYQKIDLSAGVAMTSLGKLNFPTSVRDGIDSYNYDTGLIGEANRVIYGDPRDQVTYPGVEAAGVDIYIREPLLRRVKIALAVRTNIGVSFSQITNQIRSSVYGLIQSNPLGQSIDLSSIIETVRLISGITSVVITSPAYNIDSDEINLGVGEKAFIVSQVSDISVSLIGS